MGLELEKLNVDKRINQPVLDWFKKMKEGRLQFSSASEEIGSIAIESILLRINPFETILVDGSTGVYFVEGILGSIMSFMKGNFALRGLEFFPDLEGKNWQALPRNLQRRVEECELTIYVIEEGTPPDIVNAIKKRFAFAMLCPKNPHDLIASPTQTGPN